jgi:inorganic phosphate transporter, PiT family
MPVETVLLALIIVSGLYMAWNIGASDVANAMGTSVGSGALTLRQAICIAAVLEFVGAFFFGSHVTETVQNGIIDAELFADAPTRLVYGMLASLLSAGVWLQIASYYGWPVSTTHTIVGAIVGFGFIIGGWEAIHWENVAFIVSSWLLSPLLGGLLGFVIFSILRQKVFYSPDPVLATRQLTPTLVFIVTFILSLVMLFKGLQNLHIDLNFLQAASISLAFSLISYLTSHQLLKKMQMPHTDSTEHDQLAFVEKIFAYLQILSACLMAFAHGANDVANAIGPLSAAVTTLKSGVITAQAAIPTWALALGGVGIVLGLATWGWRVILTIGKKITELTPTRGFSAEFGAAATVLIATRIGMPISTTHTLVGAVIGVGLARGLEAVNMSTMRDIVISWLITVPAGAALSVAFFYLIEALF